MSRLIEVANGAGPLRTITKREKAKCLAGCSGNAIARAVCVICAIGLCARHTFVVDGKPYCKNHVPGYQL